MRTWCGVCYYLLPLPSRLHHWQKIAATIRPCTGAVFKNKHKTAGPGCISFQRNHFTTGRATIQWMEAGGIPHRAPALRPNISPQIPRTLPAWPGHWLHAVGAKLLTPHLLRDSGDLKQGKRQTLFNGYSIAHRQAPSPAAPQVSCIIAN